MAHVNYLHANSLPIILGLFSVFAQNQFRKSNEILAYVVTTLFGTFESQITFAYEKEISSICTAFQKYE